VKRWKPISRTTPAPFRFLTQFFDNRPIPGWGQYRTPIKKLYITGACTHPGGAVTGGGRATAQVMMEDFGIDFRKVIAK
jgi:phytoene dehydrogenase-like protein